MTGGGVDVPMKGGVKGTAIEICTDEVRVEEMNGGGADVPMERGVARASPEKRYQPGAQVEDDRRRGKRASPPPGCAERRGPDVAKACQDSSREMHQRSMPE